MEVEARIDALASGARLPPGLQAARVPPVARQIERIKAQSLPGVVQKELERRVLLGEYPAGARINEQKLAASFGVSRGPVREACRALVSRGLLEFFANRGFFVRRVSDEEATDIYDLREELESLAARRFAQRRTDGEAAACRRLLEKMTKAAARADFNAYYPLNLAFHETIFVGANNARLLKVHHECVRDLHLLRGRALVQKSALAASHREHRAIFRAVFAQDAEGAASAAREHIAAGRQRMLAALQKANAKTTTKRQARGA